MAARRHLVTGGLGFLGGALARRLAQEGHRVRVLDNYSRGSEERLGDARGQIEIVKGDVRNKEVVYHALEGIDCVWHLASINGTRFFYERPAEVLDVAVTGMMNTLEGGVRQGLGELMLASSSEVYQTPPIVPTDEQVPLSIPDPLNPRYSYAAGKIISELLAINYGRQYLERVLIFRPHNVYGPNMGWEHVIPQIIARLLQLLPSARNGEVKLPIQGTGEQTRTFVYVDDCVEGLMRILGRGEHLNIYNVGTTEEVTIGALARRLAEALGVRVEIVPGSVPPGEPIRRCPDMRKLQKLGYEPRYSLDAGLRRTIEWYVAHQSLATRL